VSALELDIAAAGGATHSPLGARTLAALSRPAAAASLRVPGTAARPPKAVSSRRSLGLPQPERWVRGLQFPASMGRCRERRRWPPRRRAPPVFAMR
jgi:hypothetical protein